MLAADSSIENELAAMKAQLAGGPAARPELQAAPEAPAGGEGQA
jgi:phage shock protein A